MSVIDILTRVDAICKKYDKYDVDKHKDSDVSSDDYSVVLADIEPAEQLKLLRRRRIGVCGCYKCRDPANKGSVAGGGAQVAEVGNDKGQRIFTEEFASPHDPVLALPDRIHSIPDGTAAPPKTKRTGAIYLACFRDGRLDSEYFQESEQSNQFRQEYERRKMKQDQGLEVISKGLDTLKNMARDMNEELGTGRCKR